jgi:vacuolar-type H+-ATPase subunit E/Vma4
LSTPELRSEIERKAQEEISKIIENAKREAEAITAEATAKSEAQSAERKKALTRELEAQEKTELATLRMDRKGELLRLKSELCDRVFEEAQKRISKIAASDSKGYIELLSRLSVEGIAALSGKSFVVQANSRDVDAIQKELKTIKTKAAKIKNTEVALRIDTLPGKTLGGVVVSVEDGTQSYNNLLEARFTIAKRNLAWNVYETLFGEEKE